ncbi:MAG: hypothetical protein KDD60_08585 [Bdellovibrionales bacterium]|nr:hypothetical protein [Bdellovibrionales bacterium]
MVDVLRDNLDLAFAVKAELAKIIEGDYDENDPKNAPRLVHALLFRVEERILGALDGLALKLDKKLSQSGESPQTANRYDSESDLSSGEANLIEELINGFINLVAPNSDQPQEVWIGAFLEIVPRLALVADEQLEELKHRGEMWLEEHGYYASDEGVVRSVGNDSNGTGIST